MRLGINFLSFALTGALLGPLRCREKYDVAYVYGVSPPTAGLPALMFKLLRKVPVVFWVGDCWPDNLVVANVVKSNFVIYCVTKLVEFIYRHCDRILLSTEGFRARLHERGVPDEKLECQPQWAEEFYLRRDFTEAELPRHEMPSGFIVMFAGNLGGSQSLETIVAAAMLLKEHTNIQFVILGDGLDRKWLEEQVKEKDLAQKIHMLGSRPVYEMPKYFQLANVLLVTLRNTPVFALTMPGKMASYLAAGRPIVGAINGEGAKVIEDAQCGLCGPADDAIILAANILKLASLTPQERTVLGENGLKYYQKNLDRKKVLDQLSGILERVAQVTSSS